MADIRVDGSKQTASGNDGQTQIACKVAADATKAVMQFQECTLTVNNDHTLTITSGDKSRVIKEGSKLDTLDYSGLNITRKQLGNIVDSDQNGIISADEIDKFGQTIRASVPKGPPAEPERGFFGRLWDHITSPFKTSERAAKTLLGAPVAGIVAWGFGSWFLSNPIGLLLGIGAALLICSLPDDGDIAPTSPAPEAASPPSSEPEAPANVPTPPAAAQAQPDDAPAQAPTVTPTAATSPAPVPAPVAAPAAPVESAPKATTAQVSDGSTETTNHADQTPEDDLDDTASDNSFESAPAPNDTPVAPVIPPPATVPASTPAPISAPAPAPVPAQTADKAVAIQDNKPLEARDATGKTARFASKSVVFAVNNGSGDVSSHQIDTIDENTHIITDTDGTKWKSTDLYTNWYDAIDKRDEIKRTQFVDYYTANDRNGDPVEFGKGKIFYLEDHSAGTAYPVTVYAVNKKTRQIIDNTGALHDFTQLTDPSNIQSTVHKFKGVTGTVKSFKAIDASGNLEEFSAGKRVFSVIFESGKIYPVTVHAVNVNKRQIIDTDGNVWNFTALYVRENTAKAIAQGVKSQLKPAPAPENVESLGPLT